MGRRQRRQDVLILTETNSVAESRLETEIGYAVSPDTVEAWGLNANQQAIDRRKKPKGDIQVICERSFKPIQVFNLEGGNKDDAVIGSNVNTIAAQKEDEALTFLEQKGAKRDWLLIILGVIAGILAIAALIKVSMGGGMSCGPPSPLMAAPLARIGIPKRERGQAPQPEPETDPIRQTETLAIAKGWQRMKTKRNGHKKPRYPNCLLFRDFNRSMIEIHLPPRYAPRDSRPLEYKGHPTYLINVSRTGKLSAISVPARIEQNETPKDLYMALNCEMEIDAIYGMESSTWQKVKFGILGVIIGAELLVLFLWQSAGV